ncbi:MAG: hypothetical protein RMK52_03615 [Chitinophagales bacterium]|nr:hypothetical protein [Chitinophagales bacterium]MDW8393315.1 hypothetical protein [Chitinophagales bacterium]
MARVVIALLAVLVLLSGPSCTKRMEEIVYVDTLIAGNDPPPYDGVSSLQLNIYINRMYIDLLGREATAAEQQLARETLQSDPRDPVRRDSAVAPLTRMPVYYDRLFELASQDFINGADSAEIAGIMFLIAYMWHLDSLAGNLQNYVFYQAELLKLDALLENTEQYQAGVITVNDFFRRLLENWFYDQVNMGSENFVKAAFDDLFLQHPTEAELAAGIAMVDNAPAILFGQNGNSKGDFALIVTQSDAFYEGLIRKTYRQLLARDPSTDELVRHLPLLKQTNNWQLLQRQIIISDEYAGF